MSYELDTARRYRNHAEELRTIAEAEGTHSTKAALLNVADDYDRMAKDLEAIDAANQHTRRH